MKLKTRFQLCLGNQPKLVLLCDALRISWVDREGSTWAVFDIDGTREAARQRTLPQTEDLPPASRWLDDVCTPGYRGRKHGQVVRTRTVIS